MSTALKESLSVDRLRGELREQWQKLRPDTRLEVTYRGGVVGVWIPAAVARSLPIQQSESASIADFRTSLTQYWIRLQGGLDCVFVTYHGLEVAALVSPRLMPN